MLNSIFATKGGMSQVWTKQGKRMPVTKCVVDHNIVIGRQDCEAIDRQTTNLEKQPCVVFEIGYGEKKIKNNTKPLQEQIKKSGFSFGVQQVKGLKFFKTEQDQEEPVKVGQELELEEVLAVGDVVKVQGTSKGRGFAGVMKRHGMHGGPRTHGQSDRPRAIGSIGAMTYPGRVWKGKRMPGHFGNETTTVSNLTVIHVDQDNKEVWLSGPVPGHLNSILKITKTGDKKTIELDMDASGIKVQKEKSESADKQEEQAKSEKTE